jgi:phosphoribosylformylglycinamidine (FGAM) synthase-like amidotransferase family enzyme
MPHPERACEAALGSEDGLVFFDSVVAAFATRGAMTA